MDKLINRQYDKMHDIADFFPKSKGRNASATATNKTMKNWISHANRRDKEESAQRRICLTGHTNDCPAYLSHGDRKDGVEGVGERIEVEVQVKGARLKLPHRIRSNYDLM